MTSEILLFPHGAADRPPVPYPGVVTPVDLGAGLPVLARPAAQEDS